MVNDKLQITPNVKASYPELDGDAQSVYKGLIFYDIVRGCKVNVNDIPHVDDKG